MQERFRDSQGPKQSVALGQLKFDKINLQCFRRQIQTLGPPGVFQVTSLKPRISISLVRYGA